MSSIAASLATALPKPKYTGEFEALPAHTQSKGPQLLGVATGNEKHIVLQVGSPLRIISSNLTFHA